MATSDKDALVVTIEGDTSKFERTLSKLDKVASLALKSMAIGVTAFYGAVGVAVSKTAALGDNIDKASQRIGISAQAYQKWNYILSQNGASIDSLQVAMRFLNNAIVTNDKAFRSLNITQEELRHSSPEMIFERVIEQLQGMEAGIERNNIATKLLGRGYQELNPLLNQTAEATKALNDEFINSGAGLTDEAVQSAVAYGDALDLLKTTAEGALHTLTSELFPELTRNINSLSKYLASNKDTVKSWGSTLSSVVSSIGTLLSGVISMFNALPDSIKGTVGIGIIGMAFLGGKGAVVLASALHMIQTISNQIAAIKAVSEGKLSFFDFATANKPELEAYLDDIKALEVTVEELSDIQPMKPIVGGFISDEERQRSEDALKAIKAQIDALKDKTYADELNAGLKSIADTAKDTAVDVKGLQQEFTKVFEQKKAEEARDFLTSLRIELANMNGEFALASQLQFDQKLDDIKDALTALLPNQEAVSEKMKELTAAFTDAQIKINERDLLEKQISGLAQFRELMPSITDTLSDLERQLAKLKLNELRILFVGDDEALAKLDLIEQKLEQINGNFYDGLSLAASRFADEWEDAAATAGKAFDAVTSTIMEAFSMGFDAIFDGAEFRADKLFKALGKQLMMLSLQSGLGKIFGGLGSIGKILGGLFTFHEGGVVGENAPMTFGALKSDEVVAKLQTGERVLSRSEARDYEQNKTPNIEIVTYNYSKAQQETTQSSNSMGDIRIKQIITDTTNQNIYGGGSTSNAISTVYGLRKRAFSR